MAEIHSVAVFCGARFGTDPAFTQAARALGQGLGRSGIRLVYGGGRVGLMGVVADAALEAGGKVQGIIPDFLMRREVAHTGPMEMIVTPTMHDRKRRMFEAADAFVTMPGGIGTADETIEIISWRMLGLHDKPILICDVAGSAAPIAAMLEASVTMGFVSSDTRRLYSILPGVDAVLDRLAGLRPSGAGQAERL